jgi:hypothetical protein
VKGSFFTPHLWVQKSQEYIAKVFGRSWQDEYYVWDCAAGTGNLLEGLTNKYNVWASTIDNSDIERINALIDIDENLKLLPTHIFQFDFLNDDFDKLPESLRNIIDDPEKRKKLIMYINPPYAEAASATTVTDTGHNKTAVATAHKTSGDYKDVIGRATNELFAQFFVRIYDLLPGAKLASFSKLKYISSQNFVKFRKYFQAEYKDGFICRSDTFDNVKGKFPIGFLIWDLAKKEKISRAAVDILETNINVSMCFEKGRKTICANDDGKYINDWYSQFIDKAGKEIGILNTRGNDFLNQNYIHISTINNFNHTSVITKNNLLYAGIYLTVRHCFERTWTNDRDQFLYPNDGWKTDTEFQNDCLIFTLFHGQNRISANDGAVCANHWIPFTEEQVDAKDNFSSNFMSDFLKTRTQIAPLSEEGKLVYNAGLTLWQYYHKKIKSIKTANVNASFYDIRAFFQGRDENGKMNNESTDDIYTQVLSALRDALKTLTKKIQPKVYQYGFLKE